MSLPFKQPISHEQRQWQTAVAKARRTFGFFWRELFWDNQREQSQLQFAAVLFEFAEEQDGLLVTERIWLSEIFCDGLNVYGVALNEPQKLRELKHGQYTKVALKLVEDWMYVLDGRAYGAYTVNLHRAKMAPAERNRHDIQWGYDFGDPLNVQNYPDLNPKSEPEEEPEEEAEPAKFLGMTLAPAKKKDEPAKFFGMTIGAAKEKADEILRIELNLRLDHPVALAQQSIFENYYTNHPEVRMTFDERGLSPLHAHALAGNRHLVSLLLQLGVPANIEMHDGRTPKDMAKAMHWGHLVSMLASAERGELPKSEDSAPSAD